MNREEFIKKIYSRNYVNKMVSKVKLLGSKSNINPYDLMIVRLITSLVIFCLCLYSLDYGYIIGPIATIIYYFIFQEMVLDRKITYLNIHKH